LTNSPPGNFFLPFPRQFERVQACPMLGNTASPSFFPSPLRVGSMKVSFSKAETRPSLFFFPPAEGIHVSDGLASPFPCPRSVPPPFPLWGIPRFPPFHQYRKNIIDFLKPLSRSFFLVHTGKRAPQISFPLPPRIG